MHMNTIRGDNVTHAKLTRRRFLRKASAVAAAPYVITSAALGNQDQPPASVREKGTGPFSRNMA